MRKVKIGLVAAAAVLIVFMIYSNSSKNSKIEPHKGGSGKLLDPPDFTDTPRIDGSSIGGATKAGFVTRDPITKKPIREFGFEKLLKPEKNSEKWRLKKPYMHFYGDEFECRITSDEGNFRVKEIMGKPTPQNARLYGNVKIEITFQNEGVPTKGVIYLKDLDYDSEMSKLHTDNSIRAVFKDAVMVGSDMTLIYNSAKSRIEYFDLKDLDYIKIKDIAMLSKDRKKDAAGTVETSESNVSADKTPAKTSANPPTPKVETAVNDVTTNRPEPEPAKETDTASKLQKLANYYHCRFIKDVNIEYGNELVVKGHEELNVKNVIFSQSAPEDPSSPKPSTEKTPDKKASKPDSGKKADSKKAPASKDTPVSVKPAAVAAAPADAVEETTEVVLTCKEGFVVQLMSKVNSEKTDTPPVAATLGETIAAVLDKAENANRYSTHEASGDQNLIYADASAGTNQLPLLPEYANFAEPAVADDSAPVILAKPTRFHARKIDYDMSTKYAYATGPINLLIYGKPDPNAGPDQPQIPINITALDNAEYFGTKDQIVFNGQVVGMRKITEESYVTENSIHGDQLIVDLDSSASENSIRHISVLGETVELFSKRMAEQEVLSLTMLQCKRIDYDASAEFVTAMGPGVIEIDNSNAPAVKPSEEGADTTNSQVTLKEPCYALIEDFDSLKWYTLENKLIADGSSSSVKIRHIPVIKPEPELELGKATHAAARKIEVNFITTPQGRTELVSMIASDTVSFMEIDNDVISNSFIGDKLFYNVDLSTMLITGTEGNPCMVNGYNTDKISYNLVTGELVTNISGPSTIQLPQKPE